MSEPTNPADALDLLDWKRRVNAIYQQVRTEAIHDPVGAWERWRTARDELFAAHPQSPLPEGSRAGFRGLPYFDHDPSVRVLAQVVRADPVRYDIATSGTPGGSYSFVRMAVARFELGGEPLALELYWLEGYGGGLFLPFRDSTAGGESYGAGRYLLDTVKGADLGAAADGRLVLDFNFAYNPSCAYDPSWVCPLAPPPNRLSVAVHAGERAPEQEAPGP